MSKKKKVTVAELKAAWDATVVTLEAAQAACRAADNAEITAWEAWDGACSDEEGT